ncbi:MAG: RimK family protein [Spirochaetales bacterium]|nr:RimK family protein [Leptospiraceae bacterium]MCP5481272.1 RimK family protein [Spirochaetales bacterium]MCP5485708.1 RimK family protein [Spirochaetales bacterium]
MRKFIVLNDPARWNFEVPDVEVLSAREYLLSDQLAEVKKARIFNLCHPYKYDSMAYYVSLLGEARGHKVIPNVMTIQDLKASGIVRVVSDELDELIDATLKTNESTQIEFNIYFGRALLTDNARLARELYALFQVPLMQARFARSKRTNRWELRGLKPLSLADIPSEDRDRVQNLAREYFGKKRHGGLKKDRFIYDLAILSNPEEKAPPSDALALNKFVEAAESQGFSVEFISRLDYGRVAEFDALFIRETTAVNHHTYRFARRAQADGIVVIDDPDSILKCTNKVYLAELLQRARVGTPKTLILHAQNLAEVNGELGFPCVLKLPDSSFSQGVVKVENEEELKSVVPGMLAKSDLIVAQAFTPTDFDWRIGVLDNQPLYACRYFMAPNHWQIYNWQDPADWWGDTQTLPVGDVPTSVLETALKACRIIGDGLYGVDLKEVNGQPLVIEVNDNPSVDSGCEDKVMHDELYRAIMRSFRRRIESKRSESRER